MTFWDWLFKSTVPGGRAMAEAVAPVGIPDAAETYSTAKKEMDLKEAEHQKKINTIMAFHLDNQVTVGERIRRAANHGRVDVEISLHELKMPDTFWWYEEADRLLEKLTSELRAKGYDVDLKDLEYDKKGTASRLNIYRSSFKIYFKRGEHNEGETTKGKGT